MQAPTMIGAHAVAPDTTSLSSYFPLPGLGILPVNAFVIKAAQPVLVDTGLSALRQPFLQALSRTIDPQDIRWIWLSHMDADHLGNLEDVLALAPHAKVVVTNFLGMGKMMLRHFDVSRVHLLEPGMTIDAGDRTLVPSLRRGKNSSRSSSRCAMTFATSDRQRSATSQTPRRN